MAILKSVRAWVAITMVGASLTVGALALVRAVGTLRDPFAGFFIGPNLLVAVSQRANWPGVERGLKSLDRVVAVDGASVRTIGELTDRVRSHRPGETLSYRVERKDALRDIAVPLGRYTLGDFVLVFLVPFLLGLIFVSFGAILYFAQPATRGSLVYLAFCCVVGLYCMVLFESYTTYAFFRITLLYPIIGALSAHLFALFPENRLVYWRTRLVVAALYTMAGVLLLRRQIALYEASESLYLSKFAALYALGVLVVDVLLLARAYQQARTQASRDRIKLLVIALFIASSAFASWSLNFLLETKSFYFHEQILFASIFPVFMGYAILRRNIFNLDRVVRVSLTWGVVAAVVFILYLGVVGAVRGGLTDPTYGRYVGTMLVVLAGVGAILMHYLRPPVSRLIRRWFFRSQYDLARALGDLDRSLARGLTARDLAQQVGRRVTEILDLERGAAICLPMTPTDETVVHLFRWDGRAALEKWAAMAEAEGFAEELRRRPLPVEVGELAAERPGTFRQTVAGLKTYGIEVVVPFVSSGKLLGFLLLGQKHSRERFDASDLEAMEPIGLRMGLRLENAQLGAEAARQARLAALGQVASIMVHDIKNPLGTIKISAESLKRRFRQGERSFELAEIIEQEVDRMNETVGEILSYVKPRGLSLSPCSVNTLARETAERIRPELTAAGVTLEIDLTAEETPTQLDEARVRRALENLLANAKDATPRGGQVTVRTLTEGASNGHARILVVVEDTGPGMEASVRERVFQPFFTTKPHGTGLGLAIVKQIVQEHGGEVDLESAPGKGTRLTLHFPVRGGMK